MDIRLENTGEATGSVVSAVLRYELPGTVTLEIDGEIAVEAPSSKPFDGPPSYVQLGTREAFVLSPCDMMVRLPVDTGVP